MNRILLGALAALLLAATGMFWWQGRAQTERGAPPPDPAAGGQDPIAGVLPGADVSGLRGPAPPEAGELSQEQRRFTRLDRNLDGKITRNEMLATRTAAFRKLDSDGNNLLTFEEWAVATGNRFKAADRNGDGSLGAEEFASTKDREQPKPKCRC
jgi:hypothetical protein